MDRWGNLNMQQKAQLLGIYASKGYTDLASIINHYNTFQAGGTISTPNFVQRYSEGQRRGIKLPNGEVATHKLSYAEQGGKYIVYPNVQPMDYSDPNSPLYDYEDDNWTAFDRALKNNDTLQFNTAKEAEEYTKHYKDFGREGYLLNIPSKINLPEPKVKLQQGGHLYQEGGPTNNKSDWAKAHEVELALQQLGWNNPDNRLPSDYAAKDSNGYYAGYNLKPVTVSAKHPIKDIEPDIKADRKYWDDLYQQYLRREEAGKEYLKNIGRASLAIGTLPMLSYSVVATPLATGLSLAGGEGLNYGINKLTPYTSYGNMLAESVFNTNNELVQTALEFTNPGFLLGFNAAPFVNNQYRGLKIANELRKGVNSAKLQSKVVENPTHTRVKVGDAELGDPSTAYRQGSQPMIDDFLQTGIVRSDGLGATAKPRVEGKIFLGKNFSNPMFKQGNLWYGLPEEGSSRIGLLTTREPLQVATKSSTPNKVFSDIAGTTDVQTLGLNSGRRIPLTETQLNLENTTPYLYEPNYGYRRVQESIPTLEQAYQEATVNQQNNPIVFARSLSNEGVDNVLRDNYLEGSPSFALTRYSDDNLGRLSDLYSGDEGITFLFGKDAAGNNAKYFVGDADTPIRQDAARALNFPATEEAINNITPEQVMLGKRILHKDINSTPINWREAFNLTRENNFGDMDYFYNEVLLDKILDYRNAIGAIVNTNKLQYIKMLEDLGIPYGYNLTDIPFNFKGFQQGGSLGKVTPYGQWKYPHQITTIPSNNITMKGVDYPVIGVSDTGDTKYMLPNMDYLFDGQYVTEYPINK